MSISESVGDALDDGFFHSLCVSVDLSDVNKRHLYIDDVSVGVWNTYTSDDIDFTATDHRFSIYRSSITAGHPACFADVWFDIDLYLDLSDTATRRKFVGEDFNSTVDLGDNGELVTGSSPIVYFSRRGSDTPDDFVTNKGTGGGFTLTGSLEACAEEPPSSIPAVIHSIPTITYTYTAIAPVVYQDHVHIIPIAAYTYAEIPIEHSIDYIHTLPAVQYTYTEIPINHAVDQIHILPIATFAYDTIAPVLAQDHVHALPAKAYFYSATPVVHSIDLQHQLPIKVYDYNTYVIAHSVDNIFALPVKTYSLAYPTLIHGVDFTHILPLLEYNYAHPTLIHIADRTNFANIFDLDLTPPRELSPEVQRWLINNFAVLRNVLQYGADGTFTTSDGRILVIRNGVIEQIYLP